MLRFDTVWEAGMGKFPNGVDIPQYKVDEYQALLKERFVEPEDKAHEQITNQKMIRQFSTVLNADEDVQKLREKQKMASRKTRFMKNFVREEVLRENKLLEAEMFKNMKHLEQVLKPLFPKDNEILGKVLTGVFTNFEIQ